MSKEPELKARDKVVLRMKREGAVEENLTAGTEQRVSKRPEDAELVKPGETAEPSEALSPEDQKKVQMRRQQHQFQAEHAEDNNTQPPSETSVTEEKRTENPPQNVPEPLPSETPFKPPTLEQHGVSSHTGTVIAETVVTHKLRKTSAVEAVDAEAVLTQAAETSSAKPVSDDAVSPTKRMQKLERKSEKAHERLDAAREKLPTHKVLKKERVFDEETGKKATGWKTIDGKRYYFGLTGAAAVGEFEEDGDKKYTFSNEGVLADGIVKIDAEWKFKKEDGSWAKSEFVTSKGKIYYIGEDEAALTGWHTIEDKLYHFDNDGKLSKGLFSDDSGLYYIDKNGAQKDKWVTAGDKTYYFDGDGKAVSGWREIDGTGFYFDSDHVLQNEWTTIAGKKYFLQNGVALRGPVYIDDKYYNFGEDGYLKSGWVSWRGQKFYNNKNGTVVTGWKKIGGKRYYFNDYGMMLINTTVDGYNINNDGVAHKAK